MIESISILLSLWFAPGTDVALKDVAAPPADIVAGLVSLPAPEDSPTSSVTALVPSHMVDSFTPGSGKAAVVLIAEDPVSWSFSLQTAGQPVALEEQASSIPNLTSGASARVIRFTQPANGLSTYPIVATPATKGAKGWLLVADGREDVRLSTYFGSRLHTVGTPVIVHGDLNEAAFQTGHISVSSPSGVSQQLPFTPDRSGGFFAMFSPDQPGDWTVHSIVEGLDSEGVRRLRTTQQLLRVMNQEVRFLGSVDGSQLPDGRLELSIPVDLMAASEVGPPRHAAVACEVWGTHTSGTVVPVCWVSRMHELPSGGGVSSIDLRVDARWLSLAEVDPATLQIRELRVHDSRGFVLLDHRARTPLSLVGQVELPPNPREVQPSMCAGPAPERVTGQELNMVSSVAGHVLLLSHGYCTDQFPFRVSDFSGDYELFEDYGANLSNDEFALSFEAYGRNYKSMGIVGHSQAGHAATHLYTFYWSALDWSTGSRRIQGVGVPWLGTALAGNAAVLGEVFGIGCGVVYDLTYDGSTAWLSFIPSSVRQETWYWTTSFEDGWFYDYCQIVTDLLLSDPDDGTVEQYAGQLSGGNNQGHKTGWCHTRQMRDPPQCKDAARNVTMDQEASR